MSHVAKQSTGKTSNHPSDWDCGPVGYGSQTRSIMGGSDGIFRWSRCNEMDFRRMYTKNSDNWCLPGKDHTSDKLAKGSLSYCLCFKYFSQFKINSETYTYLAAVLKDGDVSKQVKLSIWKLFWPK